MKSGNLTKETLIRREIRNDGNHTYTYDLITKESNKQSSYRISLYSIRITLTDSEGINTEAEITDAFADFGRAVLFYDKLVRNLCTPINLCYILEDEMAK